MLKFFKPVPQAKGTLKDFLHLIRYVLVAGSDIDGLNLAVEVIGFLDVVIRRPEENDRRFRI